MSQVFHKTTENKQTNKQNHSYVKNIIKPGSDAFTGSVRASHLPGKDVKC